MPQVQDKAPIDQTDESSAAASALAPGRVDAADFGWLREPAPVVKRTTALRQTPLLQALVIFGVSRLLFVLITYVGFVLFNASTYSHASVGVGNLLQSWDQWDAKWYLEIAQHGYYTINQTAFFPLYPLLIYLGTLPFGGAGAYVVGLVVSNLAFFGAIWAFLTLAEQECGRKVAARSAWYLALFPTALFLFAPYSESLFLLLAITCFLAMRRERWWLAGILGLLAALTRSAGVLLALPFAIEYLGRRNWQWRRVQADVLSIALIPAGLGLYATFCWLRFGDPLSFSHVQAHWGRAISLPWTGLWRQVVGLWQAAPASFFQVHDLLDLGATLFVAFLLWRGWRRLPRSYSLYALALLVTMLLFPGGGHTGYLDPLASNQRFALEVFPAFLTLGLLARRPTTHQALLVVFSGLLAVLSLVFMTGRWFV
ncbi:MAG TPA: mannosyltransferase family protein [Ktedonobacterales bacterium]|jgi:Gpi18-like mannosyltransferase